VRLITDARRRHPHPLNYLVGLFHAVAIGSGETSMFIVIDDRMVTFGTVVHPRDATGRP